MPTPATVSPTAGDSSPISDSTALLPLPPAELTRRAALLIDFDGTLVEIAERPDAVTVDPALQRLLATLGARFPDRVAIVSGRSIDQLDGFLGPLARQLSVIGSHGVERRLAGREIERPAPPESLAPILRRAQDFAAAHPGVLVEPKSLGVALHYRQVPALEGEARALTAALAREFGIAVQHGKMMSEVRSGAGDKGTALRRYMATPERADFLPLFLGDDLTDEPAFVTARALGGAGVLVGPREGTAAVYGLPDVAAVRTWLEQAGAAA